MRQLCETARRQGIEARPLEEGVYSLSQFLEDLPAAVVFDGDLRDLKPMVEALRSERQLASLPLVIRVQRPDPDLLGGAFSWGVDDYIVDGSLDQFSALVSAVQQKDAWETVRAPAGRVVLAHSDRLERVKLARILKRNGFDTFFTASMEELEEALKKESFRVVIASSELPSDPPGIPLETLFSAGSDTGELPPPWIVICPKERVDGLRDTVPEGARVRFFEAGGDAEGMTFLVNEMLAPPSAGARRSERILYGTPVSFLHQGGEIPMNGYSFNINLGGIYLRTLTTLPLQTRMEVSFRPPFGRGRVVAEAQVVWRKQLGEKSTAAPPGMGLQFLDIWEADRAAYETGYHLLLDQNRNQSSLTAPPPEKL
jgi:hypothetical protein